MIVKRFKKCFPSTFTEGTGYNCCEFNDATALSKVKSEEVTEGEGNESNKGINKKWGIPTVVQWIKTPTAAAQVTAEA